MTQQQPEIRPEEQASAGSSMCYCPVCGRMHWAPHGPMPMRHMMRKGMWPMGGMMPMGIGFLGVMPALLGFIAGYLVANNRNR